MCLCVHVFVCLCACVRGCACVQARTHASTQARCRYHAALIRADLSAVKVCPTQTSIHVQAHGRIDTRAGAQEYAHTHVCACTHSCTDERTGTASVDIYTYARAHARVHARPQVLLSRGGAGQLHVRAMLCLVVPYTAVSCLAVPRHDVT